MSMLPPAFLTVPVAHRGLHDPASGRPENTLAAFRAAISAGYGIELDVQPSADGAAMVFHDDDLDRLTTRKGPVQALTRAELAALRVLGSDEQVPTLAEVLALVAGRVPLLIEVKDQSQTLAPVDGRLEAEVARTLNGYAGPLAVMSFNPYSVAHMARLAPDIPRGLTTCSYRQDWWGDSLSDADRRRLAAIPDFGPTGSAFISHEAADLHNPAVAALKARGVPILCWTIRSPEAEREARKVADNVTFEGYPAALPA